MHPVRRGRCRAALGAIVLGCGAVALAGCGTPVPAGVSTGASIGVSTGVSAGVSAGAKQAVLRAEANPQDAGAGLGWVDTPREPGVPAVLVQPVAPACLAQIEALAEQHFGARVLLGGAAFRQSDRLVLDALEPRTTSGQKSDGRRQIDASPAGRTLRLEVLQRRCQLRVDGATPPVALPACHCTLPGAD